MIPLQLMDMNFCRIKKGTKKPFEKEWTNKHYTYEQISKYFPKENYGVLTGINSFGVCDDDTSDKKLISILEKNFGDSFEVRKHYYLKLTGWDGTKIIFYDKEGLHLGELQGKGQQVVGAGSIHPSGETYNIIKNVPIKEIDFNLFLEVMQEYIPKSISQIIKEFKKSEWKGDDIKQIPLSSIISFGGLLDMGSGNYQGSHPQHGSTTGMNFRINTSKNIWHCFRCGSGGGPAELIAVMEGIIDCSQAGKNCFNTEQGREVINIAREKYGLKTPETIQQPMGWAKSVNIKQMATNYNFLDCPKCKVPFEFNERLGFFNCPSCKLSGGLKVFASTYIQSKKEDSKND